MGWDIDVREKVYQRLANEIFFRIITNSALRSAGRGGLLALRPAFSYGGLFYAFQSLFRRELEQFYCRPVTRLPEARYGGLFSGLTA